MSEHIDENDAPEMDLPDMWSLSDFMGGDPDERPYAERGWTLKCDNCGKFASRLHPVWCNPPSGGIDREVCDSCVIPPGAESDQSDTEQHTYRPIPPGSPVSEFVAEEKVLHAEVCEYPDEGCACPIPPTKEGAA